MNKDLFAEFDTLDTQEWIASIEKYLKGKPYESLYYRVGDEVEIKPFYRKDNLSEATALPVIGANDWLIATSVFVEESNVEIANAQILTALAGGVNSINLQIESGTAAILPVLLKGVFLEMVDLNLRGRAVSVNPLEWMEAIVIAAKGETSFGSLYIENVDVASIKTALALLPKWTFCNIELSLDSKEGTVANAIANALKAASTYICELNETGLDLETILQQIRFIVTIGDDYFLSIAGLRAMKRLWLALLEAFGASTARWPKIHVKTGYDVENDPYWNMIAATTQALSAAIAQVYSIEVCPVSGGTVENDFATRIARNVQQLLKMESHIDAIVDPSAGSYYIECYTAALAEKAWFLFRQ